MAERAYVYRPAQPKGQVIGDMVRDFIDRVFTARPNRCWCTWSRSTTFPGRARGDRAPAEAVMNLQLVWDNLLAYSMQIGLLVGLAAFIRRRWGCGCRPTGWPTGTSCWRLACCCPPSGRGNR